MSLNRNDVMRLGADATDFIGEGQCDGASAENFQRNTISGTVPAPTPTSTVGAPAQTATSSTSSSSRSPTTLTSINPVGAGFNKGMSVGLFNYSGNVLTNAVSGMRNLGTSWVRMDFPWSEMEPAGPGQYNTVAWDKAVLAAARGGMRILGIIDYSPSWARPSGTNKFFPPTNMADYAAFCSYLVNRYSSLGVHAWEIWNEENGSTFWQPHPDPAIYTVMLAAAYQAIKKADSRAMVILGGMATFGDDGVNYNARTFLAAIYAGGGRHYFDAVGFHPYVFPDMPGNADGNNWQQMFATTPSLRSIMMENGDKNKRIWMTEMSYPNFPGNPALTEQNQAATVRQAYQLQATYSWAGPLFWYTYQDGGNDSTNQEDWFGLVGYDGTQKPAYGTYRSMRR
jgi:polysaccharide biosynthesis protein PslG